MRQMTIGCWLLAVAVSLFVASSGVADRGSLQDLGNGICLDRGTGLMWQIGKSRRLADREEVNEYTAGLELGGYTDWRLPTTRELSDLLGLIAIIGNQECRFPALGGTYWLVDPKKGMTPARLEMESFCRGDYSLVVKNKGYVRAVREPDRR